MGTWGERSSQTGLDSWSSTGDEAADMGRSDPEGFETRTGEKKTTVLNPSRATVEEE